MHALASVACISHLCTMGCKLLFRLCKGVSLLVVVLPDLSVIPQVAEPLHSNGGCCDDGKDARNDPSIAEALDQADEASTPGRRDAKESIDRVGEGEAHEHEVYVVEDRVLLHEAVVRRSVPEEEGEDGENGEVDDAGDHVLCSVRRAADEKDDASGHVDGECTCPDHPEDVEMSDYLLRLWWNFRVNVVIDQGID